MPLNPQIPLQVKPPEFVNLADIFAQQRQRQAFDTQQQMAGVQMQGAQLENQQRQEALAGTQAMNEAYKQPGVITTGADGIPSIDPNVISATLAAKGQGHLIPGVTKSFMDLQEAAGKIKDARSKLAAEESDYAGGVGAAAYVTAPDGTKAVDPDLLKIGLAHAAAMYGPQSPSAQALQALSQDPSKAQPIADHLIAGSPKQQQLATSRSEAGSRAVTAGTGAARLTAELPKITAETAAAQAKATQDQREMDATALSTAAKKGPDALAEALGQLPYARAKQFEGMTDPAQILQLGMKPAEITTAAGQAATRTQTAARDAETVARDKVLQQQGAGRLAVEQQRLKVQEQQVGFETSGGVSAPAQMAAEGKMDPATLRAIIRRNPGIVSQIRQVDPGFDEAKIDQRYGTLKEFNSSSNSKAGGQVIALNTLIHHADLYQQTAEALKNGSFVPGNAVYNAVASAFGSAPPTNAALVARFFAGETGKVATGGVPAEGEINGILKNLGTSASPDQIANAGRTLLQIASGRVTPLLEKVKEAGLENVVHVIGPDALEILQRRGFNPDTMKPTGQAPGGGMAPIQLRDGTTLTPKNADAAAAFRKDHPELIQQ